MPFQNGNKVNAKGRNGKPFEAAIKRAVSFVESGEDLQAIEKIACKIVAVAQDPKHENYIAAVKIVAERLDGAPSQKLEINKTNALDEVSLETLERFSDAIQTAITANSGIAIPSEVAEEAGILPTVQ